MRIDKYLVENAYFKSRNKASEAIDKQLVLVNGKVINSSYDFKDTDELFINEEAYHYVSRGGYKLSHAIDTFKLDFENKVVVDIGSSTGGFTDCSLQRGASLVYSIDVGKDQLDESLKINKKVISLEETNFLETNDEFNNDYFVMDVSFISITKLLPKIKSMLKNRGLVTLIKPQFEANGLKFKNGILKDRKIHEKIIKEVIEFSNAIGLILRGITVSPIKGKNGNIEYLAYFVDEGKSINVDIKRLVLEAFNGVI